MGCFAAADASGCARRPPLYKRASPTVGTMTTKLSHSVAGARPRAVARTHRQKAASMTDKRVNKVVLAYSGGLDTSIILKWLQTT